MVYESARLSLHLHAQVGENSERHTLNARAAVLEQEEVPRDAERVHADPELVGRAAARYEHRSAVRNHEVVRAAVPRARHKVAVRALNVRGRVIAELSGEVAEREPRTAPHRAEQRVAEQRRELHVLVRLRAPGRPSAVVVRDPAAPEAAYHLRQRCAVAPVEVVALRVRWVGGGDDDVAGRNHEQVDEDVVVGAAREARDVRVRGVRREERVARARGVRVAAIVDGGVEVVEGKVVSAVSDRFLFVFEEEIERGARNERFAGALEGANGHTHWCKMRS